MMRLNDVNHNVNDFINDMNYNLNNSVCNEQSVNGLASEFDECIAASSFQFISLYSTREVQW